MNYHLTKYDMYRVLAAAVIWLPLWGSITWWQILPLAIGCIAYTEVSRAEDRAKQRKPSLAETDPIAYLASRDKEGFTKDHCAQIAGELQVQQRNLESIADSLRRMRRGL